MRGRVIGAVGAVWLAATLSAFPGPEQAAPPARRTAVTIRGDDFFINGEPTLKGRTWQGARVEGLLPNARLVQGIFDDLNPDTRSRWAYRDTGVWDADRNTREFIAAMSAWRAAGLLGFTMNMQGGSPEGYSKAQPWKNTAFEADGSLRPAYMTRLSRVLDEADRLGLAVILGLFYFGQDEHLKDEAAVVRAVDDTVRWVLDRDYRHVLIEIGNESDIQSYDHAILKPGRVGELIERVRRTTAGGRRLLVSTSLSGGKVPAADLVRVSDFVLLHGNGVSDPARITAMVDETRRLPGFQPKPIVFNEDDHYGFEQADFNAAAATRAHASWGYFDFRRQGEGFEEGYQSVPVDWRISSARKRAFFDFVTALSR